MHQEALSIKGKEIFSRLNHFPGFYVAGGTALALQIGHRVSVDFDLFSFDDIPSSLLPKVEKIFTGKTIAPSVNSTDELTVFADEVKITFLKYPFLVINSLPEYEGVKMLNTQEIAATKAYTIGRRGEYKDYVDLYFMLSEGHTSINDIIKLAEKKYDAEFNGRLFLEQLLYLDDVESVSIRFLKKEPEKKDIQDFFEDAISNIKL